MRNWLSNCFGFSSGFTNNAGNTNIPVRRQDTDESLASEHIMPEAGSSSLFGTRASAITDASVTSMDSDNILGATHCQSALVQAAGCSMTGPATSLQLANASAGTEGSPGTAQQQEQPIVVLKVSGSPSRLCTADNLAAWNAIVGMAAESAAKREDTAVSCLSLNLTDDKDHAYWMQDNLEERDWAIEAVQLEDAIAAAIATLAADSSAVHNTKLASAVTTRQEYDSKPCRDVSASEP